MNRSPRIRLPTPATYPRNRHHTPWWTRKFRIRRFLAFISTIVFLFILWRIAYGFSRPREVLNTSSAEFEGLRKEVEPMERVGRKKAPAFAELTNLVVVAGHAIWLGGRSLGLNDTEWNLAKGREGEGKTYVQHIEAGIKEVLADEKSLLVLSGGETDPNVGPRSEAQSYFDLASARNLIPPALLPRITTEFTALDSFQNLLHSIARFHEYTSNYPQKITLVSHAFKEKRFVSLHLKALNFPESNFKFIGIDPPSLQIPATREVVLEGENQRGLKMWSEDPYACDTMGPLAEKRKVRGWSRRGNGYWEDCPELRRLLSWCEVRGESVWFDEELPWNKK